MQRPNHLRPKRMLIRMGKVNLNLRLLVIEILNGLSVLGKGHIPSQCPNREVMLTRDNEEVESESEEMPPLVDYRDEEIAYPIEGKALVIRCVLNIQIK